MNIILNTDPIENRGAMVATVGLFDGVHLGHRHIINALRLRAAALGAQSMVVTFDQHPQHILAPDKEPVKQISSILDRVNRLNEAQVDNMLVFAFEDIVSLTAREFIIKLRDDYGVVSLVMGYDNHIGSDRADASQCEALGEELGVSVARISKAPLGDVSSTLIRHAIAHDGILLIIMWRQGMERAPGTHIAPAIFGRHHVCQFRLLHHCIVYGNLFASPGLCLV